MGREIDRHQFDQADFARFEQRLRLGLEALALVLERPGFGDGPPTLGAELEMSLVNPDGRPFTGNAAVLADLDDPRVELELDQFAIEFNADALPLAGGSLGHLARDLDAGLRSINTAAQSHGARISPIGILPTAETEDVGPSALTPGHRFRALVAALEQLNPREVLAIDGPEPLSVSPGHVTLEGANASFQVHLQVPPERFSAIFNAVQLATGPVLAAAGNSPIFLGHLLWDETRVPLFHQAIDGHHGGAIEWRPYRVAFGHGWLNDGPFELFAEGVALHPPLLPVCGEDDDLAEAQAGGVPPLAELRLHHGTIWRWNRPVYDPRGAGHVRIEMRALPSGPTVRDMLANAAFLIGLAFALADEEWIYTAMPFEGARRNFFKAARDGLDAELLWPERAAPSPRPIAADALIRRLVPLARRGLALAQIDLDEGDELLETIEERVRAGVTGARWQRKALAIYERRMRRAPALEAMLNAYTDRAEEGRPVHEWTLPASSV